MLLVPFSCIKTKGKAKDILNDIHFLRLNEEIIQFQVYMVNNPGHIHQKHQVK